MAGSFDAKVDISTADAVKNLRELKAEVKENAAQFRDFNKAIQESKQNVVLAAQQMTRLAQARRTNATATKEETANILANARATAVKTTSDARASEMAARRTNQEAQAGRAAAQAALADERRASIADRTARANARAADSSKVLTDQLSNTRYLMYDVGASLGVLSAATMALPAATTTVAAAYQRDFAQVLRVTEDLTNGGLDLRNELKDIARDIPIAFGDLARIATLGAQMGIANDQISAFTETTAKFVAVTGIGADQAAQLFGRLETSFNPDKSIPDFFNKVGASIAKVGADTVATDPEIASMMNQIGSLGASAGMTADQTIGLAAALASVRVQPELARGTLTRVFAQINRDVAEGGPAMQKYADVLGITSDAAAKMWKNDPSAFFTNLIQKLNGIHKANGNLTGTLDNLGVTASRDVSALTKLAVGYDVLDKSMKSAGQGFAEGTALDTMSGPVFDTLIAKLQKFVNAWSNLADSIGGTGLGPLGVLVDMLGDFANGLDALIQANPGLGQTLGLLMGFVAVTAVFLGMKAAQAFVIAGLISFQQAAGNRGVTSAMSLSGVLKELSRTYALLTGSQRAATASTVASSAALMASTQRLGGSFTGAGAMATNAMAKVKGFGSAALAMAGGPIGIALIALAALAGAFVSSANEARQAGEEIADAMARGADEGMVAISNRLKARKVTAFDGALGFSDIDKNMTEIASRAGVAWDKIVSGVANGKQGLADFNAELDRIAKADGYKNLEDALSNPLPGTKAADLQFLNSVVEKYNQEAGNAKKSSEVAGDGLQKLGVKAAAAAGGVDEAGGSVKDLDQKLKELNDTIFGTLDAEGALQNSLQKIGEGLATTGSYGTGTEGGRENVSNLQSALKDAQAYYAELKKTNALSAQEAAAGYAQFVDQLMEQIRSKGGNPDDILPLAEKTKTAFTDALGAGTPARVPVDTDPAQVATAAQVAIAQIQNLAGAAKGNVTIGADTQTAKMDLAVLATDLAKITGWPYSVVMDALTDPANAKSQELYALITAITDKTYVAPVNADTSAAIANVQNFANYAATQLAAIQASYDNLVAQSENGKGFFKGTANVILGKNYDGSGTATMKRPTATTATPIPRAAAPAQVASPLPTPNFGGLSNGYDKVRDAAQKAGDAGKKAGKDMANGIDDAAEAANDYSNRLKTGLTNAFNQQHGLQKATDDYYSTLNAITKKREDEIQQVKDLRDRVKELNNERNKDLVDANKAKIEANISAKYGETDRQADYENQAQTALDNAAAKQKDIDANKKSADTLEAGIGALDGYSDAAIANRAAVRDLESKMIDMIAAYAATGASQQQVANYAAGLTNTFRNQVAQMGYNQGSVNALIGTTQRYIDTIYRVPYRVHTDSTNNFGAGAAQAAGLAGTINGIPTSRNTTIKVDADMSSFLWHYNDAIARAEANLKATLIDPTGTGSGIGGRLNGSLRGGAFMGGLVGNVRQGFASGGLIPGTPPSNPRQDNLVAQVDGQGLINVRSREYIQPQEAVDYYGMDFMNAIRTMSLPKFNGGGSPGGYGGSGGSSNGGPVLVELTAENLQAILRLAERDIKLFAGAEQLASTVNEGQQILASKGVS